MFTDTEREVRRIFEACKLAWVQAVCQSVSELDVFHICSEALVETNKIDSIILNSHTPITKDMADKYHWIGIWSKDLGSVQTVCRHNMKERVRGV